MNLSAMLVVTTLKNVVTLLKIVHKSSGWIRPLMNHLTHFQISLRSLTVTVKVKIVHLQTLIQREKMVLFNLIKIVSQLYGLMLQRDCLQHTFCWMILLLPLILLQLLIHTSPMNLILNIYVKASKYGNSNLVIYIEPTKLPVLLDLSIFQLAPQESAFKN